MPSQTYPHAMIVIAGSCERLTTCAWITRTVGSRVSRLKRRDHKSASTHSRHFPELRHDELSFAKQSLSHKNSAEEFRSSSLLPYLLLILARSSSPILEASSARVVSCSRPFDRFSTSPRLDSAALEYLRRMRCFFCQRFIHASLQCVIGAEGIKPTCCA